MNPTAEEIARAVEGVAGFLLAVPQWNGFGAEDGVLLDRKDLQTLIAAMRPVLAEQVRNQQLAQLLAEPNGTVIIDRHGRMFRKMADDDWSGFGSEVMFDPAEDFGFPVRVVVVTDA